MGGLCFKINRREKEIVLNMKLSIVVPVYNVERFVRRCILSIINQDDNLFKEIELIIVNDGTKDNSVEQIRDLIDSYDNITLVNQMNQGLSMARNHGMALAKGTYVWFVDSDDWIAKDAVKKLMPYLDGKNDLISFGIVESSENGDVPKYCSSHEIKTISGKDTFRRGCVHGTAVPKAAYRKEFLDNNELRFIRGVYNEDDDFCLRVSYLAKTVTILPEPLYYYFLTITPDASHVSITNTVNPKLGLDFLIVTNYLMSFAKEHIKEKDIYKIFLGHLAVLVNMGLGAISKCPETEQERFIKLYQEYKLSRCYFEAGGKYFVEGVLFSLFPSKMVKIYRRLKSAK